jgi:signal transduction histidine kinase
MTADEVPGPSVMSLRWLAQRESIVLTGRLLGVALTLVAVALAFSLVFVGVGVFFLPACVRSLHDQASGLAAAHARMTGVAIRVPVIPERHRAGFFGRLLDTWNLLTSIEFWRLMRWALVDPLTGIVLAIMPFAFVGWGVYGVVALPILYLLLRLTPNDWYAFVPVTSPQGHAVAVVLGLGFIVVGFLTGSWWLRVQGRWSALLMGSQGVDLRERVDELATSRAEARQDAAAELRRIEQEVHDGTQSQLVAIGMKLGTAEALLEREPERARDLIGRAREDSSTALAELRDLMRGIRPPVLADRGLGPALEALALDATTTVTTHVDLPRRFDESLESAVYFAARELIANAIKHANASRVTLTTGTDAALLTVTVSDDGRGGASLVPGHGLDGTRRRLSVFDGRLVVNSPPGGPTTVRIEVPCGL